MRALLDVNVLIALHDPQHVHHDAAVDWLEAHAANGWASCPITQNGCLRVMSQPAYPQKRSVAELIATLGSDYAPGWAEERRVDQVVLEHGTAPLDELYFALKPLSRNLGAVEHAALVGAGEVFPVKEAGAGFTLYRIGDAVASRNIHAGIYDALRYGVRW